MSNFNENAEIGWGETIEDVQEGGNSVVLEAGQGNFKIMKLERKQFAGSSKLPPCMVVELEIQLFKDGLSTKYFRNFFQVRKCEWTMAKFFKEIGLRKEGEAMNVKVLFESSIGITGTCDIKKEGYFSKKHNKQMFKNEADNLKNDMIVQQQPVQQPPAPQFQAGSGFDPNSTAAF